MNRHTLKTKNQFLNVIVNEKNKDIGILWFSSESNHGENEAFLYDIEWANVVDRFARMRKITKQDIIDFANQKLNDNQRVVKPGSIGLYAKDPTKDVMIESIFLRPSGLAYNGKFKLSIGASDDMSWSRVVIIEIDDVLEIPGETITGIYNYDTGTVD